MSSDVSFLNGIRLSIATHLTLFLVTIVEHTWFIIIEYHYHFHESTLKCSARSFILLSETNLQTIIKDIMWTYTQERFTLYGMNAACNCKPRCFAINPNQLRYSRTQVYIFIEKFTLFVLFRVLNFLIGKRLSINHESWYLSKMMISQNNSPLRCTDLVIPIN